MTDLPSVHITRTDVFIGGEKLPGLICEGGVTLKTGGGTEFNVLTVDFIVGVVEADDPVAVDYEDDVARYSSKGAA